VLSIAATAGRGCFHKPEAEPDHDRCTFTALLWWAGEWETAGVVLVVLGVAGWVVRVTRGSARSWVMAWGVASVMVTRMVTWWCCLL
jgi:hypothetical protein